MQTSRDLKVMAVLTGAFLALAAAVLFGGVSEDVLLVAPLLVLVVPLLGGRYVGEEGLERLRSAFFAAPAHPRAVSTLALRRAPSRVVRTGLLLAAAHSSRPPPARAAALA